MSDVQKTVTIEVATTDLQSLKQSGYMLCFSIQVDESFDVVWSKSTRFVSSNTFSWTNQFELYAKLGASGDSATNTTAIAKGQSATLAANGLLGGASDGGPADGITLVNRYGSVRPALKQWACTVEGTKGSFPCYETRQPIVKGQATVYPIDILKVWFSQDGQPLPLMAERAHGISEVATVDLTGSDQATRRYANGSWSTPSS